MGFHAANSNHNIIPIMCSGCNFADPGWTTAFICLTAFTTTANFSVLSILLPSLAEYFGTSEDNIAWVSLAPIFVTSCLTPIAGAVADRFDRARVWLVGFTINVLSMLVCALAPQSAWFVLVVGRGLSGLGAALDGPSGFGLVAAKYAPNDRGTPIGLLSSTMTFAPSLGILAGGVSTRFISWRVLFWAPFGIGLLLLVVAHVILRARDTPSSTTVSYPDPRALVNKGVAEEEVTYQALAGEDDVQPQELPRTQSHVQVQQQQQQPDALPTVSSSLEAVVALTSTPEAPANSFDVLGAVLLFVCTCCLLFVVNQAQSLGATSPLVLAAAATCVATFIWLWWHVKRSPSSCIVPVDMFRDAVVSAACCTRWLLEVAYMGTFILLPFFLDKVQDRDTWITSSVLFARPALMACVAMFAGRLSRWADGAYCGALILLGGVVVSGVCAAFCFLTVHTPLVVIALLVGAQGVGWGLSLPLTMSVIASRVPQKHLSSVSGTVTMLMLLGDSLGIACALALLQAFGGSTQVAAYQTTFVCALCCAILGTMVAVFEWRLLKRRTQFTWAE